MAIFPQINGFGWTVDLHFTSPKIGVNQR